MITDKMKVLLSPWYHESTAEAPQPEATANMTILVIILFGETYGDRTHDQEI